MSKDKKFQDALLDLFEREVLDQSDEDILRSYAVQKLEEVPKFRETKELITEQLLSYRKSRLQNARKELDANKPMAASQIFGDAKEIIIGLMQRGLLPPGMTLAFRNGEDIPDEDLISLLDDLREMGIDIDGQK